MLFPTKDALLQSIPAELPPIIPLTTDASSWLLHLPRMAKPPHRQNVRQVFQLHPPEQHALQLYGKRVLENRYSQIYVTDAQVGSTYKYSGVTRPCQCCDPSLEQDQWILDLCQVCNVLYSRLRQQQGGLVQLESREDAIDSSGIDISSDRTPSSSSSSRSSTTIFPDVYNGCLVNWYQPHHHIGLHADDERELNANIPIVSVSWGGPRRFLLRPKPGVDRLHPHQFFGGNGNGDGGGKEPHHHQKKKYFEIVLQDGDVLVMGGKCQQEFKHEIPKVRKMDGLVGDRISWTIRSMHHTHKTHQNVVSSCLVSSATLKSEKKRSTETNSGTTTTDDSERRIKRERTRRDNGSHTRLSL